MLFIRYCLDYSYPWKKLITDCGYLDLIWYWLMPRIRQLIMFYWLDRHWAESTNIRTYAWWWCVCSCLFTGGTTGKPKVWFIPFPQYPSISRFTQSLGNWYSGRSSSCPAFKITFTDLSRECWMVWWPAHPWQSIHNSIPGHLEELSKPRDIFHCRSDNLFPTVTPKQCEIGSLGLMIVGVVRWWTVTWSLGENVHQSWDYWDAGWLKLEWFQRILWTKQKPGCVGKAFPNVELQIDTAAGDNLDR